MAETSVSTPQWLRDRHMRLSTTPFGFLGAGWLLYSAGVLGAVYGFLLLPPRGWGFAQVGGAVLLLLGLLAGVAELLSRSTHNNLARDLNGLPFGIEGYPEVLGQQGADEARLRITFAADAPDTRELEALLAKLDVPWLAADPSTAPLTLQISDARGEGTNWRLHSRLRLAIDEVCVPAHRLAEVATVEVSASASSARTSASDE